MSRYYDAMDLVVVIHRKRWAKIHKIALALRRIIDPDYVVQAPQQVCQFIVI